MSLDTGMSGHLLGDNHYFDMNASHLKGELKTIQTNFRLIEENKSDYYFLQIKPLSQKKKKKLRPIEEAMVDELAQDTTAKVSQATGNEWEGEETKEDL